MKSGIYKDFPFEDYLAIDAFSNTAMGQMEKSPYHYKNAKIDGKQKHFVIGSMVHAGRLEPKEFCKRYAVEPPFHLDEGNVTDAKKPSTSKATRYVKEKQKEFRESESREIVSTDFYNETMNYVTALYLHTETEKLINAPGEFELTLVWEDPETGILCKGRMDKANPDQGCFVDLKTCADILKFPRSFTDYGYARQMAHYRNGYAVLTGELLTPWICAVEKQSPFCVQSAPVDEESLDWGQSECDRLIELLAECREKDEWPGPEQPEAWRVAEWKLNSEPVELVVNGQKVSI